MDILSVDLEDLQGLMHRRFTGESIEPSRRVLHQAHRVLELLDRHSTKATFFVLATVAKRFPALVRSIVDAGHEVASHGTDHLAIWGQSHREFLRDAVRSKATLEDISGRPVRGYRAPYFSMSGGSMWPLSELVRAGYTYDSSVMPVWKRGYRRSFDAFPHRHDTPAGPITEFPVSTIALGGVRLPVAGGGYFRALPLPLIFSALQRIRAAGRPLVLYFHPYEFDDRPLDLCHTLPPPAVHRAMRRLACNTYFNLGRASISRKLSWLLRRWHFGSFAQHLRHAEVETEAHHAN